MVLGFIAAGVLAGCAHHKKAEVVFLGVPESQAGDKGPVGLVGGKAAKVNTVTAVSETTYEAYHSAKQAGRVFAEEVHGDYVYYAVKAQRDARFDHASAWVEITERFKARKP